jgi:hypothetical protein
MESIRRDERVLSYFSSVNKLKCCFVAKFSRSVEEYTKMVYLRSNFEFHLLMGLLCKRARYDLRSVRLVGRSIPGKVGIQLGFALQGDLLGGG